MKRFAEPTAGKEKGLCLFVLLLCACAPTTPGEGNVPPEGFTVLFNGHDLSGWQGFVADQPKRMNMDAGELAAARAEADERMSRHWSVVDGVLVFDGLGRNLVSEKDYEDFELLVDWKIEPGGDSGIYLRGSPQVQIWEHADGSGGLYNNQKNRSKPLLAADNPPGEWNRFRIRMVGERVTVRLNGKLVVDDVPLENYWDRSRPVYGSGPIELQSHGSKLCFRNIFLQEIVQP